MAATSHTFMKIEKTSNMTIKTTSTMQYGPNRNQRKIILEVDITSSQQTWLELYSDIINSLTSSVNSLIVQNTEALGVKLRQE